MLIVYYLKPVLMIKKAVIPMGKSYSTGTFF